MKFDNKPCDSNNERGSSDIGFLAGIVALFVLPFVALWAFSDSLPFQDEITVYEMSCSEPIKDGICKAKEETLGRTTFKAFPNQQVVIHWSEEGVRILQRDNDCVVRDSKNWSCKVDGSSFIKIMADGKFRYGYYADSPTAFYTVHKGYWWWVRITQEMK